jgi:hypothetical protein
MKISTTDSDFSAMEAATAKRGETVRVSKEALRHLLSDHIVLLALARRSTTIEAGDDQRSLR